MRFLQRCVRALLFAVLLAPLQALAGAYTGLYVLGDSLSDQGNLLAATGALAETVGKPAQPDVNNYYRGRFSNGPVYPEVLAGDLGLTITNSLAGGNNFAFGGARNTYNTVESQGYPVGAYPWSLVGQRDAFTARYPAGTADPNALYVVFSGSNDVADIITRRLDPATTIANAVAGVISVVDAFKTAGAKTVLVPNLPDISVTPRVTSIGSPRITALASLYDSQFNAALSAALGQESGVRIIQFDTFDLLRDVVGNPGKYGFSNATQSCYSGFVVPAANTTTCSTPDQYVFWDIEHPTAAFHALLGNLLFEAAVPEPMSLALVGGGLAALASLRRGRFRPIV